MTLFLLIVLVGLVSIFMWGAYWLADRNSELASGCGVRLMFLLVVGSVAAALALLENWFYTLLFFLAWGLAWFVIHFIRSEIKGREEERVEALAKKAERERIEQTYRDPYLIREHQEIVKSYSNLGQAEELFSGVGAILRETQYPMDETLRIRSKIQLEKRWGKFLTDVAEAHREMRVREVEAALDAVKDVVQSRWKPFHGYGELRAEQSNFEEYNYGDLVEDDKGSFSTRPLPKGFRWINPVQPPPELGKAVRLDSFTEVVLTFMLDSEIVALQQDFIPAYRVRVTSGHPNRALQSDSNNYLSVGFEECIDPFDWGPRSGRMVEARLNELAESFERIIQKDSS